MKPFFYIIGGILIIGALLIISKTPRDPVAWAIAAVLAACGALFCWLNRG